MTYKELKCEVETLGFGESIAKERGLAIFANRALRRIFTDLGIRKTVKLYARDNRPCIVAQNITYTGRPIEFSVSGGAYSVEVAGVGSFTVKCKENIYEREFNTDGSCFKDFIDGSATLTFSGRHSYLIRRIATFPMSYGAGVDSIPDADGRVDINVAKRFGDFICFTGLPTDKSGTPVAPISMVDGVITLPDSFVGELFVSYLRTPRVISEITPDEQIDLPDGAVHLLPLLCAAYIYLEYDGELAKYYTELYERELASVCRHGKPDTASTYFNVSRWA